MKNFFFEYDARPAAIPIRSNGSGVKEKMRLMEFQLVQVFLLVIFAFVRLARAGVNLLPARPTFLGTMAVRRFLRADFAAFKVNLLVKVLDPFLSAIIPSKKNSMSLYWLSLSFSSNFKSFLNRRSFVRSPFVNRLFSSSGVKTFACLLIFDKILAAKLDGLVFLRVTSIISMNSFVDGSKSDSWFSFCPK